MPTNLAQIKHNLDEHLGQPLTVTIKGRSNTEKVHHGTLASTFPAIFIVELVGEEESIERVSYSYRDVLTNTIKLDFEA
ncbi:Veg family protein [Ligilactobacillus equi]|uniref:VEG protein n=2 Tax=Ligilactobacillus equi TaxID=137357 RepID=V7HXP9_9LACO|nr:Veg family protein [Ligilactobacillus equi]ETA73973.1 VEG protein [Ligilactobacillus equi DPC 6820]KRL82489.1 hypothetical protein FC36_GL000931 [Ligilactobacillus equi DSM 15833 = JCM 10991]MCQ2556732.1 Veg family protein [Ligilactobacillus sp.]